MMNATSSQAAYCLCHTILWLSAVAVVLSAGAAHGKMSVLNSPHNMSASGPGGEHKITFPEETRVCVFCHVPHSATADSPLWSRTLIPVNDSTYRPYMSTTLRANPVPNKPTGASRFCLSCHDGTIAIGDFHGSRATNRVFMPSDPNPRKNPNFTADPTAQHHPISFEYTEALALNSNLVSPSALPPEIRLENGSVLQCNSCHDPHDNQYGQFLVKKNDDPQGVTASPLCVTCHQPLGWTTSSHNLQNEETMTNGCISCHYVHNAPGAARLLHSSNEEDTCLLTCHQDIKPSFTQMSRHSLGEVGVHDQKEALPATQPHVECVDCHNPHYAIASDTPLSSPPLINGALQGVRKDDLGTLATREYDICFKCHTGPNSENFNGTPESLRVIQDFDQLNRFDVLNPSYHPVTNDRKAGPNGESLLAEYRLSMTRIYCTDCHNSDQGTKAGGAGPNGPHGSQYNHILIAQYIMPVAGTWTGAYNSSQYALCFRCHSEDFIMGAGSGFTGLGQNEHVKHVQDRSIPCFACHDPHGTSWQAGATPERNSHLINFDLSYAAGTNVPTPIYTTSAPFKGSGSCTVNCHTNAGYTHGYGAGVLFKPVMPRSTLRFP